MAMHARRFIGTFQIEVQYPPAGAFSSRLQALGYHCGTPTASLSFSTGTIKSAVALVRVSGLPDALKCHWKAQQPCGDGGAFPECWNLQNEGMLCQFGVFQGEINKLE